ncbi:MAG: ABC transporter ATP-binding protein [Flavobacteriales bacterium]|nr:ABC transporter ATP-binding protein [Flavobacteriales bacterium]|tara:strand:+ start:3773 stop:4678 length:906 start_codon:yes stop_codon:yes gene_type:complete
MNVLEVKSLSKSYSNHKALDKVSLTVPEGKIFGLLGPNGAGKTTLIRIINQITIPDSGGILFEGDPLGSQHISYIGYLPEERGLYKKMKVGEQALFLAQLKGLSNREAKLALKFWFERFEIEAWWNKKVEDLSKGMAQKIQFITTVLHNPKLLIFDEPFSGFDPINANIIKDEILSLKDKGTSIIFSTHRMESVEEICDHIALIDKSKKILDGPIDQIKNEFKQSIYQVEFSSINLDFLEYLPRKFECISKKLNQVEIKIKDSFSPSDLIRFLLNHSDIIAFNERIPTINEIFIRTVKENH